MNQDASIRDKKMTNIKKRVKRNGNGMEDLQMSK